MADRILIGLIGTGGIMNRHIRDLQGIAQARVVALADPDPERTAAAKKQYSQLADVPEYATHKALLEGQDLDAVVIASPHNVHCEQIVDSLRAGCHVLTEKPMVCTIDDAHTVMQVEEETGKMVGIAYQRHTQGEFRFIKRRLESGEAGEVQAVVAFQGQNWYHATQGKWRQVKEISCGGQLNDSGSHLIDVILWTTGLKADRVTACIENFDAEVDINSALTVEFANGALGSISVIGNCPVWWEDITFVCSKWSFFLRQGQLTYSTGQGGEMLSLQNTSYGSTSPTENFVKAITGEEDLLAPSICGLRTIELTEAAWRSAASGAAVNL